MGPLSKTQNFPFQIHFCDLKHPSPLSKYICLSLEILYQTWHPSKHLFPPSQTLISSLSNTYFHPPKHQFFPSQTPFFPFQTHILLFKAPSKPLLKHGTPWHPSLNINLPLLHSKQCPFFNPPPPPGSFPLEVTAGIRSRLVGLS